MNYLAFTFVSSFSGGFFDDLLHGLLHELLHRLLKAFTFSALLQSWSNLLKHEIWLNSRGWAVHLTRLRGFGLVIDHMFG